MCFWFDLEILRLQVYKKSFLKKYLTVSILFDLLSSQKSIALSPRRVENNFLEIVRKGYQKKAQFVLISKRCKTLVLRKRVKNLQNI